MVTYPQVLAPQQAPGRAPVGARLSRLTASFRNFDACLNSHQRPSARVTGLRRRFLSLLDGRQSRNEIDRWAAMGCRRRRFR